MLCLRSPEGINVPILQQQAAIYLSNVHGGDTGGQ